MDIEVMDGALLIAGLDVEGREEDADPDHILDYIPH
jgi:hypothetical protein